GHSRTCSRNTEGSARRNARGPGPAPLRHRAGPRRGDQPMACFVDFVDFDDLGDFGDCGDFGDFGSFDDFGILGVLSAGTRLRPTSLQNLTLPLLLTCFAETQVSSRSRIRYQMLLPPMLCPRTLHLRPTLAW